MTKQYFFPDTTVLINFAVIGRLGLLAMYLRGCGRMTQAVRGEIRRSAERVPNIVGLDFDAEFGKSIVLDTDSDIRGVQNLRKRFARRGDAATKHLGESETLHVMTTREEYRMSRFATEDRAAYEMAAHLGVLRHTTMEIFQELVANGNLDLEEAFSLVEAIESSRYERTLLRRPNRPQDLLA